VKAERVQRGEKIDPSDKHFTMLYFKSFMESGGNFMTRGDGEVLWKCLL